MHYLKKKEKKLSDRLNKDLFNYMKHCECSGRTSFEITILTVLFIMWTVSNILELLVNLLVEFLFAILLNFVLPNRLSTDLFYYLRHHRESSELASLEITDLMDLSVKCGPFLIQQPS